MGYESIWRTGPDGVLTAEAGGLRLVVLPPSKIGGTVRFLVLRRDGDHRSLIGSGTEESVRAAMDTAVRMAGRMLVRSFPPTLPTSLRS